MIYDMLYDWQKELIDKYKQNIIKCGTYPEAFRNALGDYYYIARFENKSECKILLNLL